MQEPFSCLPATMKAIQATLSAPRLARYAPGANADANEALRFYLWNARLCESFYVPCQITEVACRNAILKALIARHGIDWFAKDAFRLTLPRRLRDELDRLSTNVMQSYANDHASDRIVSGLTFGFWVHLLTKGLDFTLWKAGIGVSFPFAPAGTARDEVYRRMDRVRVFRNRIAHHEAVFDKRPTAEHANMAHLTGWICRETQWLLARATQVPRTINARPRW